MRYSLKEFQRYCLVNHITFVSYKLPGEKHPQTLFTNEPRVYSSISDIKCTEGFLMSPFHSESSPILVIPDEKKLPGFEFEIDENEFLQTTCMKEIISVHKRDIISFNKYITQIENAKKKLSSGTNKKVVISRIKKIYGISIDDLIDAFKMLCDAYPHTFTYLLHSSITGSWLGATPEKLLQTDSYLFSTMALAGTKKHSESIKYSEWTDKEIREHEYVADHIRKKLKDSNYQYLENDRQTVRAGNVTHLLTEFVGKIKPGTGWLELVNLLYPTPAICGNDNELSLELIHETESHRREYYSGIIGLFNHTGKTDLFVNLRCMTSDNSGAYLFAGGGILPESSAFKEWEETEMKFETLLNIFGKIKGKDPEFIMKSHTNKLHVNIFADLCASYGIHKIVVSPGSRNAPLTVAFHNQPAIECYLIPDERSAAYFALGLAQYLQEPVGIICTSGTAALNYAPAIAEAYYQNLPLVAITADRPPEWIDQLDGQAINQDGIYENFTSYQATLPVEIYSDEELWLMERIIRDGFLHLKQKSLPIHFNVPLREPLYEMTDYIPSKSVFSQLEIISSRQDVSLDVIQKYKKILIIAGMKHPSQRFSDQIHRIVSSRRVVVLDELLSNLDIDDTFRIQDAFFLSTNKNNSERLKPDLVISFGDIILSKQLKQWVRSLNTDRWVVTKNDKCPDVFRGINKVIIDDPVCFLKNLCCDQESYKAIYFNDWKKIFNDFMEIHSVYHQTMPWSDMLVFKIISSIIPGDSIIHLSNSSPVRYAQFFEWNKGIRFYSNRGTAGIDGCMSTAIGMAAQTSETVTLVTGDIGFLYDSNALWNVYKKQNFKIIVINNKGGNIFDLIPGPQNTGLLKDYFTAYHPISIEYLCKAFGVEYISAANTHELKSGMELLYANKYCSLLEIQTEPSINTGVWKGYFEHISDNFSCL